MMQPVYILSAAVVSPQQHYEDTGFLDNPNNTTDGMLFVKEPNYRKYINPVAIRRMSKLLKMGISTGMNALEQAGIQKPDAIIAGTGRGSMVDTEQFLLSMIHQEEEALTPTSFIQSTYNSVNGWLALQTKSNGYNQTYVNRGTSFELSLFDAMMLLNETSEDSYALVGCLDEITPDYVRVKSKIGYWKEPIPANLELLNHSDTPGTIAGEGAAFFVVSNNPQSALCSVKGMNMLQDATATEVTEAINQLLAANDLTLQEVDVVLCGLNGDSRQQEQYNAVIKEAGDYPTIAAFKHLCGEYDTSSGFATWMATELFARQDIPAVLTVKRGDNTAVKNVLLVNHYILNSTSIILFGQP